MKLSLILPSFKRAELLDFGLHSLSLQHIDNELEIIVINDGISDDTELICKKYPNLAIKYIFSGQRNSKELNFRTPAIAFNIGIKQAKGDIVILSNPEIFHLNNTIGILLDPLLNYSNNIITTAKIMFDNEGAALSSLMKNFTLFLPDYITDKLEQDTPNCKYSSQLPFCIGLYKQHLLDIGGYDEDLIGWACEDDDLIHRLLLKGLKFYYTGAKVIHLYHDKQYSKEIRKHPKFLYNYNIYQERKNIVVRNVGKDWGKL